MKRILNFIRKIFNYTIEFINRYPIIEKALHTFWQAFAAVFIAGMTPILSLITNGKLREASVSIAGLVVAAIASGLSAVKTYAQNKIKESKTKSIDTLVG